MNGEAATLRAGIVASALGGVLVAWIAGVVVGLIALERFQHSLLDAASAAMRASVVDARASDVVARVDATRDSLEVWGVEAAAFDRRGTFLGGDARLRADGLPTGRAPAPAVGRQFSLAPTRDGYVLLAPDPDVIARFRLSFELAFAGSLAAVALAAVFGGGAWARARTHANDRTRAASEDRLRAFLAEAGHELRTPLAIAVGYTGILKRGALADRGLADRIVDDISAEHARLQRLVDRIQYLARLDAVAGDPQATSDAARIADEAIALVRPLDLARTIALDAPATAWARIDPDDLRDALRNLVENAIRYAPGAPIDVRVRDGDEIAISVEDCGPGMDALTRAHAFDRFFRGPERGDVTGSGLGLAIVRRIVERAGGRASLESERGRGTTVVLRIPRAAPPREPISDRSSLAD